VKLYAKATHENASPKTYRWYLFGIAVLTTTELVDARLDEIGTEQIAALTAELQESRTLSSGPESRRYPLSFQACPLMNGFRDSSRDVLFSGRIASGFEHLHLPLAERPRGGVAFCGRHFCLTFCASGRAVENSFIVRLSFQ
jgi:hypothetical protein